MDTLTMPATVQKCGICDTKLLSKKMIKEHSLICSIKHSFYKECKKASEEQSLSMPSQFELINFIVKLSDKYDKLEQKVDKLQKTIFQLRKKNVDEYLKTISPASILFSQWISKFVITEKELKILFEKDFKECLRMTIVQRMEEDINIPIKSFIQRPQTMYIYDKSISNPNEICWRAMQESELEHFTRVLCHRIGKGYTEWAKNHESEIEKSQKMQELSMIYLNKSNGSSMKPDQKLSEVKKTLISGVQVSLKNLE